MAGFWKNFAEGSGHCDSTSHLFLPKFRAHLSVQVQKNNGMYRWSGDDNLAVPRGIIDLR